MFLAFSILYCYILLVFCTSQKELPNLLICGLLALYSSTFRHTLLRAYVTEGERAWCTANQLRAVTSSGKAAQTWAACGIYFPRWDNYGRKATQELKWTWHFHSYSRLSYSSGCNCSGHQLYNNSIEQNRKRIEYEYALLALLLWILVTLARLDKCWDTFSQTKLKLCS